MNNFSDEKLQYGNIFMTFEDIPHSEIWGAELGFKR